MWIIQSVERMGPKCVKVNTKDMEFSQEAGLLKGRRKINGGIEILVGRSRGAGLSIECWNQN